MKTLPYHQAHIIHVIKDLASKGFELTPAGANISFKPQAMEALIRKGLVKQVTRSRTRQDDMEEVFWQAYELVPTELEKELA